MNADIHVGDVGTHFRRIIEDQDGAPLDCSAGTVSFIFKPPTLAKLGAIEATPTDDGEDGDYYIVAGDIWSEAGEWKGQVKVVDGATVNYSNEFKFTVKGNL
jgi:hypothetical protein